MSSRWGRAAFAALIGALVVVPVSGAAVAKTTRVSVNSIEVEAKNGASFDAFISANGRFVVFDSNSNDLVGANDQNTYADVFIRDRRRGKTKRVSVTSSEHQVMNWSGYAHVSPSGRFVAFQSDVTNLVPNDDNGFSDVFVRGPLR